MESMDEVGLAVALLKWLLGLVAVGIASFVGGGIWLMRQSGVQANKVDTLEKEQARLRDRVHKELVPLIEQWRADTMEYKGYARGKIEGLERDVLRLRDGKNGH